VSKRQERKDKTMITKKAGKDYPYDNLALTLPKEAIGKHDDGWTITGKVHEDYYEWVNEFDAQHKELGHVWGDFEDEVFADSEEAFASFYAKHGPAAWDYLDI
jgi:hypothetical protein